MTTLVDGTRLGKYLIVRHLGSGGMADVYEAEDSLLGRRVALKVLPPELARNPQFIQRFESEVRKSASLNHGGIVPVFDFGFDNGTHYYSMRLLTHGSLRNRIEEGMTDSEALSILRDIADALGHAHSRQPPLVHRDVKPENILFDEQGRALLTDFGIAKAMDGNHNLTATGVAIGSALYMSPEQARGKKDVDGRADLYSLGAMFHEMLTGLPPYEGEDQISIILKHVTEPIPQLPERFAQYQSLLDAMLAKNPAQRVASARDLVQLIDPLLPPRPTRSTPGARTTGQTPTAPFLVADLTPPPPAADPQRAAREAAEAAEAERLRLEAAARSKAEAEAREQQQRLAAERQQREQAAEAERQRLAEAEAKAKQQAEREAQQREEARIAAEKAAEAERQRLAEAEAKAKQQAEREARQREEARIAAEKAAEQQRIQEQQAREARRLAEERQRAAAAEARRQAEEEARRLQAEAEERFEREMAEALEAEQQRLRAEQEAATRKAAAEAEAEQTRLKAAQDAARRKAAEDEARRQQQEQQQRGAERLAREQAEARQAAEAAARKAAAEQAAAEAARAQAAKSAAARGAEDDVTVIRGFGDRGGSARPSPAARAPEPVAKPVPAPEPPPEPPTVPTPLPVPSRSTTSMPASAPVAAPAVSSAAETVDLRAPRRTSAPPAARATPAADDSHRRQRLILAAAAALVLATAAGVALNRKGGGGARQQIEAAFAKPADPLPPATLELLSGLDAADRDALLAPGGAAERYFLARSEAAFPVDALSDDRVAALTLLRKANQELFPRPNRALADRIDALSEPLYQLLDTVDGKTLFSLSPEAPSVLQVLRQLVLAGDEKRLEKRFRNELLRRFEAALAAAPKRELREYERLLGDLEIVYGADQARRDALQARLDDAGDVEPAGAAASPAADDGKTLAPAEQRIEKALAANRLDEARSEVLKLRKARQLGSDRGMALADKVARRYVDQARADIESVSILKESSAAFELKAAQLAGIRQLSRRVDISALQASQRARAELILGRELADKILAGNPPGGEQGAQAGINLDLALGQLDAAPKAERDTLKTRLTRALERLRAGTPPPTQTPAPTPAATPKANPATVTDPAPAAATAATASPGSASSDPCAGQKACTDVVGGQSLRAYRLGAAAPYDRLFLQEQEVSVELYSIVMGVGMSASPRLPVTGISGDDARRFADKLSAQTHHRFRLPTAAEFQLAAREIRPAVLATANCASGGGRLNNVEKPIGQAKGAVNIVGNAAEIVADGGRYQAAGASYRDAGADCAPDSLKPFTAPDPGVGFRLLRVVE